MQLSIKQYACIEMGPSSHVRRIAIAFLGTLCFASTAAAVSPERPIRFIVTTQPGGNNDTVARIVASKLAEALGQPVVVENRPGANGMIGAKYVAGSAPDGHTLLIGTTSLAMLPATVKLPAVDVLREFVPIANLVEVPVMLVAAKDFKVSTLEQAVAAAKAAPGKVTIAITAPSYVFYSERMSMEAGISLTRVHYKGAPDALNDVIGGRVDLMLDTVGVQLPHIRLGKTRPLAVFTAKRQASLPDVPTMDEAGFKGFADNPFVGLFAAAGTPITIVERLNSEIQNALRSEEVRNKLEGMGLIVTPLAMGTFGARVRSDIERYEEIARKANLLKE